jgi:hypothetical protein
VLEGVACTSLAVGLHSSTRSPENGCCSGSWESLPRLCAPWTLNFNQAGTFCRKAKPGIRCTRDGPDLSIQERYSWGMGRWFGVQGGERWIQMQQRQMNIRFVCVCVCGWVGGLLVGWVVGWVVGCGCERVCVWERESVCMSVCVCVGPAALSISIYIYIYIYLNVYIYIHICIYKYICGESESVCACVCVCVWEREETGEVAVERQEQANSLVLLSAVPIYKCQSFLSMNTHTYSYVYIYTYLSIHNYRYINIHIHIFICIIHIFICTIHV